MGTVWIGAHSATFQFVQAGEYQDAYGQQNDEPALVFGDVVVLEGEPRELRVALQRAIDALDSS